MTEFWMPVEIVLDVEMTKSGLHVITSPLIRGLMVVGETREEALSKVEKSIRDLHTAMVLTGAPEL